MSAYHWRLRQAEMSRLPIYSSRVQDDETGEWVSHLVDGEVSASKAISWEGGADDLPAACQVVLDLIRGLAFEHELLHKAYRVHIGPVTGLLGSFSTEWHYADEIVAAVTECRDHC